MKLDSDRPFRQLINDMILPTLDYISGLPCIVMECGDWSVGGARPAPQPGRHYYVRISRSEQADPFPYGSMITLRDAGEMQVKSIERDGAFWLYTCTAAAARRNR